MNQQHHTHIYQASKSLRERLDLSDLHRRLDGPGNQKNADVRQADTLFTIACIIMLVGATLIGLAWPVLEYAVRNGLL